MHYVILIPDNNTGDSGHPCRTPAVVRKNSFYEEINYVAALCACAMNNAEAKGIKKLQRK